MTVDRAELAAYTSGVLRARADYYRGDTIMTPSAPAPVTFDLDQARTLADDLIRQLAEHPGDDAAVCAVLIRWLDQLDWQPLALICMAAVRTTFGECLIPHPDRVPADGLTLDPNKTGATP